MNLTTFERETNLMFTFTKEQLTAIIAELYFIETIVKDSVKKVDIKPDWYYKKNCKYVNQLKNKLEIVYNAKSNL